MQVLHLGFRNGDPAAPLRQAASVALARIEGTTRESVRDVLVVVSELVQNVTQHTRSHGTLSITVTGSEATVEASDNNPTPARVQPPDSQRIGGRGLLLVQGIAGAWGVHAVAGGKKVWARIPIAVRKTQRAPSKDT